MSDESRRESWEEITAIVESGGSPADLDTFLDTISPAELARALSRLDDPSRTAVLTLLNPEDAADLLEELSDAQGADLLEELAPPQAAAIVDEMESDERADVLGELDSDEVEAILREMDPEEAEDARTLLTYPPDTAGGLMVTEFVAYPMSMTVRDVLQDLRKNAEMYSDYGVQYVYVLSEEERLVGVVRLRDLVLSPGDLPLPKIMIPNPLYALASTELDELDHVFERYTFVGLPVTNEQGTLVGVVRRSDVEEAQGERAEEALMRFGGIISGEELRSMPVTSRAFRRLMWLVLNLGLSLCAASIIMFYRETMDAFIELAFFIPVIGNMSGCSGNQAVAVSIREMSLGLIKPEDYVRVFIKEAQVGVLNGLAIGGLIAVVSYVWLQNPMFSLVVGSALAINSVVALSLGGLIPLVLRRVHADPALAAPLAVTTLADMCGFFLMLSMAAIVLA
ncbi:MAG: magnesium transporter [bacterium]|nr:magnesium transporter [bacterium]